MGPGRVLPGGERCAAWGVVSTPGREKQSLQPNDMEKCTKKKAEREFLICDYFKGETGKMRCEKPKMLPCGDDGQGCRVWIHDWRARVEGPEFKLLVVHCKTHDRYFTVYPPGWAPYERTRMAPEAEAESSLEAWEGTMFHSAVSDSWMGRYASDGTTNWRTHRRRLLHGGKLLGLTGTTGVAEEVSALLEVGLAAHQGARSQFACGALPSQRQAVRSVLESLTVTARLWRQMVRAGCAAGVWGRPWYGRSGGALEALFQPPERAGVSSVATGK